MGEMDKRATGENTPSKENWRKWGKRREEGRKKKKSFCKNFSRIFARHKTWRRSEMSDTTKSGRKKGTLCEKNKKRKGNIMPKSVQDISRKQQGKVR